MFRDAPETTQEEILKSETITLEILIEQMNTVLDEGLLSLESKLTCLLKAYLFALYSFVLIVV